MKCLDDTFYFTLEYDDNDNGYEWKGERYAECRCLIKKMSQKYNSSDYYTGQEINVRQKFYLNFNDEVTDEMIESAGALKDGKLIE